MAHQSMKSHSLAKGLLKMAIFMSKDLLMGNPK